MFGFLSPDDETFRHNMKWQMVLPVSDRAGVESKADFSPLFLTLDYARLQFRLIAQITRPIRNKHCSVKIPASSCHMVFTKFPQGSPHSRS